MSKESYEISITWTVEDVQYVCPSCTKKQAIKVLDYVQCGHDANLGITWETLECAYDHLFPS